MGYWFCPNAVKQPWHHCQCSSPLHLQALESEHTIKTLAAMFPTGLIREAILLIHRSGLSLSDLVTKLEVYFQSNETFREWWVGQSHDLQPMTSYRKYHMTKDWMHTRTVEWALWIISFTLPERCMNFRCLVLCHFYQWYLHYFTDESNWMLMKCVVKVVNYSGHWESTWILPNRAYICRFSGLCKYPYGALSVFTVPLSLWSTYVCRCNNWTCVWCVQCSLLSVLCVCGHHVCGHGSCWRE